MDFSAITKLPPQRIAMIVAGGIGAGLLWRHFNNRNGGGGGLTADGTVDMSKYALGQNSAGNLAAAGTQQVPSTNDAIRDVGQGTMPIPVTRWVTTGADGVLYYANESGIIGPINTPSTPGTTRDPSLGYDWTKTTTPPPTIIPDFVPYSGPTVTDAAGQDYDPRYIMVDPRNGQLINIGQYLIETGQAPKPTRSR